jgi:hypothetical protein
MSDDTIRNEPTGAADPLTRPSPAGRDQELEQERLDAETRTRFRDDPGDPKDRLAETEHERLMEQATSRELHP